MARTFRPVYGNEKCPDIPTMVSPVSIEKLFCQRFFSIWTVNVEILYAVIDINPKLTARELAKQFPKNHTSTIRHCPELGKVSNLGQWVSLHSLTKVTLSLSLKSKLAIEPFVFNDNDNG